METQTKRLVQADEGDGSTTAVTESDTIPAGVVQSTDSSEPVQESVRIAPEGYENVAPELWPGLDGKPPKLTEALMRKLRGKYMTVKLVRLEQCGHKYDPINEPRHKNCETCWWQFFNTHPALVETADQFYRTQGRKPMIGMRGETFVKMFVRYMATVIRLMQEERAIQDVAHSQERPVESGSIDGTAASQNEGGQVAGEVADADKVGEVASGQ